MCPAYYRNSNVRLNIHTIVQSISQRLYSSIYVRDVSYYILINKHSVFYLLSEVISTRATIPHVNNGQSSCLRFFSIVPLHNCCWHDAYHKIIYSHKVISTLKIDQYHRKKKFIMIIRWIIRFMGLEMLCDQVRRKAYIFEKVYTY